MPSAIERVLGRSRPAEEKRSGVPQPDELSSVLVERPALVEEVLNVFRSADRTNKDLCCINLCGLPGTGKTILALQIAQAIESGKYGTRSALFLKCPSSPAETKTLLAPWKSKASTSVLILDGVPKVSEVAELLKAFKARVLLTSRDGKKYSEFETFSVPALNDTETLDLLDRFFEVDLKQEADAALLLGDSLGRIPGLLVRAARRICELRVRSTEFALDKFLDTLASSSTPNVFKDIVEIASRLAKNKSAFKVMTVFASVGSETVPQGLVSSVIGCDEKEAVVAAEPLISSCLCSIHASHLGPSFVVNSIARRIMRKHVLKDSKLSDDQFSKLIEYFSSRWQFEWYDRRSWYTAGLMAPSVLSIADSWKSSKPDIKSDKLSKFLHVVNGCAEYLRKCKGLIRDSLAIHTEVLKLCRKTSGLDHFLIVSTLLNLCEISFQMGEAKRVSELCDEAEKVISDSRFKPTSKVNLGHFLEKRAAVALMQSEPAEAQSRLNEAFAEVKKLGFDEQFHCVPLYFLKLRISIHRKKSSDSNSAISQLKKILEKIPEHEKHPEFVLCTVYNAFVIFSSSPMAKADADALDAVHASALTSLIECFGTENHPSVARFLALRGSVLINRNLLPQALEALEKSLKIKMLLFGETAPEIALAMCNAGTFLASKQPKEAIDMLSKALPILTETFGARSNLVLKCHTDLAEAYSAKSNYEAALEHFRAILDSGMSGEELCKVLRKMGALEKKRSGWAAATGYLSRALEHQTAATGARSEATADIREEIADVKRSSGDAAAAREYLETVVSIRLETVGRLHVKTALTYETLARVCRELGDNELAMVHVFEAADISATVLGPEDPIAVRIVGLVNEILG